MSRVSPNDPNHAPRARAMSMPNGFIDTATVPAISIFRGDVGTIAADIRTIAPTHEISGSMVCGVRLGSQCWINPDPAAMATMKTSPRLSTACGSRSPRVYAYTASETSTLTIATVSLDCHLNQAGSDEAMAR